MPITVSKGRAVTYSGDSTRLFQLFVLKGALKLWKVGIRANRNFKLRNAALILNMPLRSGVDALLAECESQIETLKPLQRVEHQP